MSINKLISRAAWVSPLSLVLVSCVALDDTIPEKLTGLYCDDGTSVPSSFSKNCLCMEFDDQDNLSLDTYRDGEKIDTDKLDYVRDSDSIIADFKGGAGLGKLEFLILSKKKIAINGDITKGIINMTFTKRSAPPLSCQ